MANQIGRCNNLELCTVAVSQRLISVPAGSPFICDKCGEPLQVPTSVSSPGRRRASIGIQLGLLLLGVGAVAWKLAGPDADFAQVRTLVASLTGAPRPSPVPTAVPTATVQAATVQAAMVPVAPAATDPAANPLAATPASATAPALASAEPASPGQVPVLAGATAPAVPAPAAVAVAAAVFTPAPEPARGTVPSTTLLRLAGSDAVAPKLIRRLASSYLALIGDTGITAAPSGTPRLIEVSGMQTGQREVISIAETSSAGGFNALLRGSADMAVSNRKITAAEAEKLQAAGDPTMPLNEHVIAVQGIAVIVHPANRVASLTASQVRGILGGKITSWSEVGGQPGAIKVQIMAVLEDGGDTPQDAILATDALSPAAIRSASEQAVAARVAGDRDSLGIVSLAAAGGAKVLPVADGSVPPVAPNEQTLASESYPFSQRLYLYGANTSNGFVRRFADYVASASGQAAVEAAGYVSLAVRAEAAPVPDIASDRYKQLVQGATRMSVDFRFQPGSFDLDSRGYRDMDRVIAYLKAQRVNANKIVLAAFADNSGQPATNVAVSQRRAEVVASALAKGGFNPGKIASFGAELPIADNATAEGRERNRRVEVYLVP